MNVNIANFKTLVQRITPVLDTSAYAAGDVLFPTTAITLDANGKQVRGRVEFVGIQDKDDQTAQTITLWFLRSNVVFGTANAAPSISDADGLELIGKVVVTTSDDLGAFKQGQTGDFSLPFEVQAGVLYVAATTAGTPTHTASGIVLRVGLEIQTN